MDSIFKLGKNNFSTFTVPVSVLFNFGGYSHF